MASTFWRRLPKFVGHGHVIRLFADGLERGTRRTGRFLPFEARDQLERGSSDQS